QVTTVNGTLSIVMIYAAYTTKVDCAVLEFSGHSFTDSFDSSIGPYAKTHADMRGDIAANGNAKFRGQAVINGSVYTPVPKVSDDCDKGISGITLAGNAVVKGIPPYEKLTPVSFAMSPLTRVSAGPSDLKVTSDKTLVPDGTSPQYRNVVVDGKATLTLKPGIYNINSLKLQRNATVVAEGPVILNIAGENSQEQSPGSGKKNRKHDDNSDDQNQGEDEG